MYKTIAIVFLGILPAMLYSQKTKLKKVKFYKSKINKQEYHVLKSNKNIKHGLYNSYYTDGSIKESGQYEHNRRNGEWKEFDSSGKLKRIRIYKNGKKISDKKVGIWESSHENGKVIKRYDYDNNKELPTIINVYLNYPAIARENGIQGTVEIKIKLNDNCEIQELKVSKPLSKECDEAALNSLKEFYRLMKKYDNKNCNEIDEVVQIRFKLE